MDKNLPHVTVTESTDTNIVEWRSEICNQFLILPQLSKANILPQKQMTKKRGKASDDLIYTALGTPSNGKFPEQLP